MPLTGERPMLLQCVYYLMGTVNPLYAGKDGETPNSGLI